MPQIQRYRHKPTEIVAVQWTGDNFEQVAFLVGSKTAFLNRATGLVVLTEHGPVDVEVGEHVVKGINDSYPITAKTLDDSYDLVPNDEVEGQLTLPGM